MINAGSCLFTKSNLHTISQARHSQHNSYQVLTIILPTITITPRTPPIHPTDQPTVIDSHHMGSPHCARTNSTISPTLAHHCHCPSYRVSNPDRHYNNTRPPANCTTTFTNLLTQSLCTNHCTNHLASHTRSVCCNISWRTFCQPV